MEGTGIVSQTIICSVNKKKKIILFSQTLELEITSEFPRKIKHLEDTSSPKSSFLLEMRKGHWMSVKDNFESHLQRQLMWKLHTSTP